MSTLEMGLTAALVCLTAFYFFREGQRARLLAELEAVSRTVAEGLRPEPLEGGSGPEKALREAFNHMASAVNDRENELRRGGLAALQLVARTVDEREEFTRGRSRRVMGYAADLARRAGLSAKEIQQVADAASLIDIGKVAIPDDILKKPSALTDEERAIMETHPAIGECFVRRMPGLGYVQAGVLHHHEHWDGGGYPGKLAGEKIPLMARIIAIADAYDAMTSERPYRKGFLPSTALRLIEQAAGRQFDPDLAQHFIALQRENLMRLEPDEPPASARPKRKAA